MSGKSYGLNAYAQQATDSSAKIENRNEIFEEFRPRILAIARRISDRIPSGSTLTVEDLASYGAIGLLEAIDRFDPSRNIQFTTFADYRIRGSMIDALRSIDDMSRHRREQARDLETVIAAMSRKFGRPPTKQEIADEMGISLEDYFKLKQNTAPISQSSISPSAENEASEGRGLLETLADEACIDPLTLMVNGEMRDQVKLAIDELSERKRNCVLLYYGRNMNLAEIAAVFDLTPSRISQILSSARKELRNSLRSVAIVNGFLNEESL